MTAQKGSEFVLKIGNGGLPETFTTLSGMRTTRLLLNHQTLEANHAESGAWRLLQTSAGIRYVQVNVSGIFMDSAQEELVRAQAFAASILNYQLRCGNGDVILVPMMISRYERAGNVDAVEQYSIVFESAGAVVFTAG